MGAPVIDPIGRYRYAQQLKESGKPYPEFVDMVLPLHDKYWQTEAAMTEASPVQMLEAGRAGCAATRPLYPGLARHRASATADSSGSSSSIAKLAGR